MRVNNIGGSSVPGYIAPGATRGVKRTGAQANAPSAAPQASHKAAALQMSSDSIAHPIADAFREGRGTGDHVHLLLSAAYRR